MKFLKLKNFLLLGATGISILLAAVLLGAGQLVFSGLFLGGGMPFRIRSDRPVSCSECFFSGVRSDS